MHSSSIMLLLNNSIRFSHFVGIVHSWRNVIFVGVIEFSKNVQQSRAAYVTKHGVEFSFSGYQFSSRKKKQFGV